MTHAVTLSVALPKGVAEVSAVLAVPDHAWAAVAVAHGAGAGMEHPWLAGLTDALHAGGVATLRFNFPYREAGRRMPGPAAHAIATWSAALACLTDAAPGIPACAAGKSYGGRMASMAAAEGVIDPAGLVYLGYPLHPPGDPQKERAEHLPRIAAPQLFVSGTRDPFIQPLGRFEAAVAACQDAEIAWIEDGGHSFEVAGTKRTPAEAAASVVPTMIDFLRARARR